jgi:nucleotide-binding universal stress UspA family protein
MSLALGGWDTHLEQLGNNFSGLCRFLGISSDQPRAGKPCILRREHRNWVALMKAILVPVEHHPSSAVLQTALVIGHAFDSYIEGVPTGPSVPDDIVTDVGTLTAPDSGNRREWAKNARQQFEAVMAAHSVPPRPEEPRGLCFGWHGDELVDDDALGCLGRAFDLIVVGRPGSGRDGTRMATVESALFDSGRPVLIVPPSAAGATLGDAIVISWNGSAETARAVSFAMPFLIRARRVVVLTVKGAMVEGPSGEQIAATLRLHGVAATALTHEDEGRSPGAAILAQARQLGADLLVKGAYTQSRIRELIFGGATRHILEHTGLPVLMAH